MMGWSVPGMANIPSFPPSLPRGKWVAVQGAQCGAIDGAGREGGAGAGFGCIWWIPLEGSCQYVVARQCHIMCISRLNISFS